MAKRALVISGGGSHGAFAVGSIKYFLEQGLTFDIVSGTSTGALIGPFVLTNDYPLLEDTYTTVTNDDILQDVSVQVITDKGYLYSFAPLRQRIDADVTPARAQQIFSGQAQFYAVSTCMELAKLVYLQAGGAAGKAPAQGMAPVQLTARKDLVDAMFASASQPVLIQSVPIKLGNKTLTFVDGGVLDYAPVDIAIANGATEVYLVMLHVEPSLQEPQTTADISGLQGALMRTIDLLAGKTGEDSLALSNLYAQGTQRVAGIRARAEAAGLSQATIDQIFEPTTPGEKNNPFSSDEEVVIWVIRPTKDWSKDGLEFDPATMKGWLADGYARAKAVLTSGTPMKRPRAT